MTNSYPHIPTYDAEKYALFRPTYPDSLFEYLFSRAKGWDYAWDCACGNGQATLKLAEHFKQVIATDISETQIAASPKRPNVLYYVTPASNVLLDDDSVDLITVAQALHWFADDSFFQEVKRVLKPSGIIGAWCYDLPHINPEVDALIYDLAYNTLKNYWAPGKKYLQTHYTDIPFPFTKEYITSFHCEKEFNFEGLIGYLESWSARTAYLKQHQRDPLEQAKSALLQAWGDPDRTYLAHYPIYCLIGSLTA